MKGLKKLITGVLAATMIMSASITAFAGESVGSELGTDAGVDTPEIKKITVDGAVDGEQYSIYKMLDLAVDANALKKENSNGYSYTLNSKWEKFWTEGAGKDYIKTFTSGDKTYIKWTAKDADMEAFGKAAAKWAIDNKVVAEQGPVTAANKTAEFSGLDFGYFMVTSTLGSAVSIATTPANPVQTIKEKNTTTITEKKIKENGALTSANDAQIGDSIEFVSTVKISKNQINVKYHDVMTDGLTWNADSTKVFTDLDSNQVFTDADLEVTAEENFDITPGARSKEDPDAFVVSFTNNFVSNLKYKDGVSYVYIQYTATLNDNALVGRDKETNKPIVTYGRNGRFEGTPTETVTHNFKILKYDGADATKNPLDGAKFKVFEKGSDTPLALAYKQVADDQKVTVYRVVDMSDLGATLPDGYVLVGGSNELITVADEQITVEGVDFKEYEVLETEAPLGFNKIEGKIPITVNEENKLLEVKNLSGSLLPSTGGIGTTIFYILGSILIVAGVAYFIVRRKANAE